MKNGKSEHYWRIHKRVALRVLSDLSPSQRQMIAHDAEHFSHESQWFKKKVEDDAARLYEDPAYYDNQEFSFRVPKHEKPNPKLVLRSR